MSATAEGPAPIGQLDAAEMGTPGDEARWQARIVGHADGLRRAIDRGRQGADGVLIFGIDAFEVVVVDIRQALAGVEHAAADERRRVAGRERQAVAG